jgi:rRNA maturation endonuclease Nob1
MKDEVKNALERLKVFADNHISNSPIQYLPKQDGLRKNSEAVAIIEQAINRLDELEAIATSKVKKDYIYSGDGSRIEVERCGSCGSVQVVKKNFCPDCGQRLSLCMR